MHVRLFMPFSCRKLWPAGQQASRPAGKQVSSAALGADMKTGASPPRFDDGDEGVLAATLVPESELIVKTVVPTRARQDDLGLPCFG